MRTQEMLNVKELNKDVILNNVFGDFLTKFDTDIDGVVKHEICDLTLIYRVKVDTADDDVIASFIITDAILEAAGLTEAELFERVKASKNFTFKSIFETIAEYTGEAFDFSFCEGIPEEMMLYVITTESKMRGSFVVATDYMKEVREKLGKDLLVLPCSRHEIIVLRYNPTLEIDEIKNLVSFVNQSELRDEDFLSDSVYLYTENGLEIIEEA